MGSAEIRGLHRVRISDNQEKAAEKKKEDNNKERWGRKEKELTGTSCP